MGEDTAAPCSLGSLLPFRDLLSWLLVATGTLGPLQGHGHQPDVRGHKGQCSLRGLSPEASKGECVGCQENKHFLQLWVEFL